MNAARRSAAKRGWPRGLYEREGWFYFREPGGKTWPLGRVPLAVAKSEAIAANQHLENMQPKLVQKMTGAAHTLGDVLDIMKVADRKNTARGHRSLDKKIRAKLGGVMCSALTVMQCAEFLDGLAANPRTQESTRSRLMSVCREAQVKGWMEGNPAEITRKPTVTVQRGRLTLDTFKAIYAKAAEVNEWLQHAMMLGLVTGADRSSIALLQRSDVMPDGYLIVTRPKTGARVAIPLALTLDVVGVTLADLVKPRTKVLSKHLLHHTQTWGNAPAGSPVFVDNMSKAFTEARKLAGIPDEGAPTFHELRSLCKRLYNAQGGVDTKALLGHTTDRMSTLYENTRGVEATIVKIS